MPFVYFNHCAHLEVKICSPGSVYDKYLCLHFSVESGVVIKREKKKRLLKKQFPFKHGLSVSSRVIFINGIFAQIFLSHWVPTACLQLARMPAESPGHISMCICILVLQS